LLEGKFQPGDLVEAVVVDGDLQLQVRNRIEQLPAPEQPASPEAALSAGGESSSEAQS